MAELSGAHCALCSPRLSAGGEKVSWRGLSVPAANAATIQRWLPAPSAVACVRVNSTCLPSGERIGEDNAFKWRRSSFVGKRGAVCGAEVEAPDCPLRSEVARTKQTRGRASLNRSMRSGYNGEAVRAGLAELAELCAGYRRERPPVLG